jgi:hypothetical protein
VSEINNGCESARAQIDVIINAAPASPAVVSPVIYCQGATAAPLTATGTNLLWFTTPNGGTGTASLTPQTTIAGDKSYYVSQTIGGCESPRSEIIVTINPGLVPDATITSTNTNVCQGTLISFSAIVNNAGTNPSLQWLLNGNPIPGETGLNYSSSLLTGTSTISFQVNSTAVCANPVQIISNVINLNITPNAAPLVIITAEPDQICIQGAAPQSGVVDWLGLQCAAPGLRHRRPGWLWQHDPQLHRRKLPQPRFTGPGLQAGAVGQQYQRELP